MNHYFQSVLMIDDDEATNFLNKRIIKKLNPTAEVKIFNESSLAISYLKRPEIISPDLMLLDVNMPATSGWEVLKNLSTIHKNNLSIVVLSSYISKEQKEKFSSSDYKITFIEKPLSLDKLNEALIQI